MRTIQGIHHVTAIAGDPQRNVDFYAGLLGLRLVKLTVNFDDPGTYHLYYGNYSGDPGTILTFFPWRGVPKGRAGAGQVTVTSFSVPPGSLEDWKQRLTAAGVRVESPMHRFDEQSLSFQDPDGMGLELVATATSAGPISSDFAIHGFHSATLAVANFDQSAALLSGTMGFRLEGTDSGRHRFLIGEGRPHQIVDLIEVSKTQRGTQGAGSVHHIAWRTPDDAQHSEWREELVAEGQGVSPIMDRKYFHSIYYREPSGILYEIATDPPGFTIDEPLESLGSGLVLPPWLEPERAALLMVLPKLHLPELQHA